MVFWICCSYTALYSLLNCMMTAMFFWTFWQWNRARWKSFSSMILPWTNIRLLRHVFMTLEGKTMRKTWGRASVYQLFWCEQTGSKVVDLWPNRVETWYCDLSIQHGAFMVKHVVPLVCRTLKGWWCSTTQRSEWVKSGCFLGRHGGEVWTTTGVQWAMLSLDSCFGDSYIYGKYLK